MKRPALLAATAITTLAGTTAGIVVAAPALAYPPGTHMSVRARPIGEPDRHRQTVLVKVKDGKPGCTILITGGGDSESAVLDEDGRARVTLEVKGRGEITITAKTTGKCKGGKETASTTVRLSPGEGHGHGHCKRGREYRVDADRWRPRRKIEFVATDGKHTHRLSGTTDGDGHAFFTFTPQYKGSWAIILLQDGESADYTLEVD